MNNLFFFFFYNLQSKPLRLIKLRQKESNIITQLFFFFLFFNPKLVRWSLIQQTKAAKQDTANKQGGLLLLTCPAAKRVSQLPSNHPSSFCRLITANKSLARVGFLLANCLFAFFISFPSLVLLCFHLFTTSAMVCARPQKCLVFYFHFQMEKKEPSTISCLFYYVNVGVSLNVFMDLTEQKCD